MDGQTELRWLRCARAVAAVAHNNHILIIYTLQENVDIGLTNLQYTVYVSSLNISYMSYS